MNALAPPKIQDPFAIGYRWVTTTLPDGKKESIEVPLTEEDFLYPQEDDRFMLTPQHILTTRYLHLAIESACRTRPDVKVFCDHRIDWQHDDLRPNGPDVIVFDHYPQPIRPRRATLPVLDEGARPLLIVEVTSPSTRNKDLEDKLTIFHDAGVPVYLIVDMPEEDSDADPVILAHRYEPEGYVDMDAGDLGYWVESVGMWFAIEDGELVAYDATRNRILEYAEVEQLAEAETQRADEAEQRELAERKRADAERKRAEAEKQRAVTAEQRERAEKQRADELARELAELRLRLNTNGKPSSN